MQMQRMRLFMLQITVLGLLQKICCTSSTVFTEHHTQHQNPSAILVSDLQLQKRLQISTAPPWILKAHSAKAPPCVSQYLVCAFRIFLPPAIHQISPIHLQGE